MMPGALHRPFRIESASSKGGAIAMNDALPLGSHLDRILGELALVRSEIVRFQERDPAQVRERDRNALWAGIETIHDAINSTKHEIATLHSEGPRGERLLRATDELEAVVTDTEDATETILSGAEFIDAGIRKLIPDLTGANLEIARSIEAEVVKTFEACNFQDITGQRIRKVVNLLKFIEERVARMTEIWGSAELASGSNGLIKREGDAALLNGPALACDTGVVSQEEIDGLFS